LSQEFGTLLQQAQIQNNLGIAYFNLKHYQKAKECYGTARIMYERINSRVGLGNAVANLGEVMFAEGEYEFALKRWLEAKTLFASLENAYALTETTLHLANVFSRLGDVQKMGEQLDEAQSLIRERELASYNARYFFLRGIHSLMKKEFHEAEEHLTRAKELYEADNAYEKVWLTMLKMAEVKHLSGKSIEATEIANSLLSNTDAMKNYQVLAEANYLLGLVAIAKPTVVAEKPILYFKNGLDAVAKEPVGETTWKLTYALAREYYQRGQLQRSKEFLLKTKLVVQFFLSHFQSTELKQRYLATDQKHDVLATIEAITKQEGNS
jgi:tetratricopeptide (TPR) repeat protein